MMTLERFHRLAARFKDKKILVVGDIILDRYIFGSVDRISPEAPVPVVKVSREEFRVGGAGNVAANLDRLGASGILLGIAGDDPYCAEIFKLKGKDNLIVKSGQYKTLVKTRIISQRQQIVRVDREEAIKVTPRIEEEMLSRVRTLKVDGIIVSDYAKGTLTEGIMEALKQESARKNLPLIVDPKPPHFHLYSRATGITPNLIEAEEIVKKKIRSDDEAAAAARYIQKKFKTDFSLITRGDKGITAAEKGKKTFHTPACSHEVFDVTGAGDTVASVLTLALASGATLKEAVILANTAASIVIEKIGTAQVTIEELRRRIGSLRENV